MKYFSNELKLKSRDSFLGLSNEILGNEKNLREKQGQNRLIGAPGVFCGQGTIKCPSTQALLVGS